MTQSHGKAKTFGLVTILAVAIVGGACGGPVATGGAAPKPTVAFVQPASDTSPVTTTKPVLVKVAAKVAHIAKPKARSGNLSVTDDTDPTSTTDAPETTTTAAAPTTTTEVATTTTAAQDPTTTTEAIVMPTVPPLPPAYSGPALVPSDVLTITPSTTDITTATLLTLTPSLVDGNGTNVPISYFQWAVIAAPDGVQLGQSASGTSAPNTLQFTPGVAGDYTIQCAVDGFGQVGGPYDAVTTITFTVND